MSVCAVVRIADNIVVNKIMAEPDHLAPDGCYLVLIPEGVRCDMGWPWDGENFIDPNPPEPTTEPETSSDSSAS